MKKVILSAVAILLVIAAIMMSAGCSTEKYSVDYCGQKEWYSNAKDSYRAGKKVTLYFTDWATEMTYSFYLDGEYIPHGFDYQKGMIVSFTMPDHDVKLECVEGGSWFGG